MATRIHERGRVKKVVLHSQYFGEFLVVGPDVFFRRTLWRGEHDVTNRPSQFFYFGSKALGKKKRVLKRSRLTDLIPKISKGSYILWSIVVVATLYDKRPNAAQPRVIKRLLPWGQSWHAVDRGWDTLFTDIRMKDRTLLTHSNSSALIDTRRALARS